MRDSRLLDHAASNPAAPNTHLTVGGRKSPALAGNGPYIARPTDASLPRNMPVGTYLKKQKLHLYYERNEKRANDLSVILWRGHRRAE